MDSYQIVITAFLGDESEVRLHLSIQDLAKEEREKESEPSNQTMSD